MDKNNKWMLILPIAVLVLLACQGGASQSAAVAPANVTAAPVTAVPTATKAPTPTVAPAVSGLNYRIAYWFSHVGESTDKLQFGTPNVMRLGAGKKVACPGQKTVGSGGFNDENQTFIVRAGPSLTGMITVENGMGVCYEDTLGNLSVNTSVVAEIPVGIVPFTTVTASQNGNKVTFTSGSSACTLDAPGKVCSLMAGNMVYYFRLVVAK